MMASESSLKKRKSLLWKTTVINLHQKQSPTFTLMDRNWILELNPVYFGKENILPSRYNIKIKSCSEIPPFQPFDVVTHLEDRRSNLQMHCSKLTISSSCETLFEEDCVDIHKKLPGLEIYEDMVIVCTFYPSSVLQLSTKTVSGSSLRIRHSLVWKTEKPKTYDTRESPVFNLKKSKWTLAMHLSKNVKYYPSAYAICLKNETSKSFEPFEIETFLQDRTHQEQIHCSTLTVSSKFETLYKDSTDSIYKRLPGLKHDKYIVIVCIFSQSSELEFGEKNLNDITITLESNQHQNEFFEDDVAEHPFINQLQASKFLSEFQNLSKDFGLLLDGSFMTDMQLKCGDEIIHAHKAILAVRCTVFAAMLQNERFEHSCTIEITDTEPSVLREFLRFLYCGKISIDVSEDMLCKLYTASHQYEVQPFQKLCSSIMNRKLNVENCIKFLIVANTHKDQDLISTVTAYIIKRPKLLMDNSWIKFSDEFPKLSNEIYRTYIAHCY